MGRSKVFWLSTSPASEGSSSPSSPSSGSLRLSSTSSRRKSPSKSPSIFLKNIVFSLEAPYRLPRYIWRINHQVILHFLVSLPNSGPLRSRSEFYPCSQFSAYPLHSRLHDSSLDKCLRIK